MEPLPKNHYVKLFRKSSPYLNQGGQADQFGRPTNSRYFDGLGPAEQLQEIVSKKHGPYGPVGLLEIAKLKLKKAKDEWQYNLKVRNKDSKTPAKGNYADAINRALARKQVLEEESRFLNKILRKEEKVEDLILKKQQKKFRYKGLRKRKNNEVWQCDFRLVENRKFVDDGSDLDEYIFEVKKRKRAKSLALRQIEKKEMEKVEKE